MIYHGYRFATGIVELRLEAKRRRSSLVGFQGIQSAEKSERVNGGLVEIAHEPGVLVVITTHTEEGTGVSVMDPITALAELKSIAGENRQAKGERSVADWLLNVCGWIEQRETENTQREIMALPVLSDA